MSREGVALGVFFAAAGVLVVLGAAGAGAGVLAWPFVVALVSGSLAIRDWP